jgi:transposase
MGEDVSELLDMIAAQMKAARIVRIKKPCRRCERMVQETAANRPVADSMAEPNLLGHVPPSGRCKHRLPVNRSQSSMITFFCIASTRYSPAWGPTFPNARLSAG